MFYVATNQGFVGERKPVINVRWAKNFDSFDEADGFARYIGLRYYAVLRSC
jgi:hypothetical protein